MKRQIRRNVFETNSSSTHSLTMCSEKEFESWKNGDLLFDYWDEIFVEKNDLTDEQKNDAKENYEYKKIDFWKDWNDLTEEEKNKWYKKYAEENNLKNRHCHTYDEWMDDDYLEYFINKYTTEGGEKIVAFGKYGYDG